MRWLLVFLISFTCTPTSAESVPFKLAVLGASTACGTGASSLEKAYPALLATELRSIVGRPVELHNQCRGGAISFLHLYVLQSQILPLQPDLLILHVGTLDMLFGEDSKKLGEHSIDEMFRIARASRIPTIILYFPTRYAELPRDTIYKFAQRYRLPVADAGLVASDQALSLTDLTTDNVHANDAGHKLIAQTILYAFRQTSRIRVGQPSLAVASIHTKPCKNGCSVQARSLVLLLEAG